MDRRFAPRARLCRFVLRIPSGLAIRSRLTSEFTKAIAD